MSGVTFNPESFSAKSAAAMANWMKRPIFLISFFSILLPGSKPLTSPAILQENAVASNAVMPAMPLFEASRAAQDSSVPIPSGVSNPTPVTTTLRDKTLLPGPASDYFLLVLPSMYSTASLTVWIFSASSSGISSSKASSKAITSSTISSESAPKSSTNDALLSTWLSSTPNCSTIICFTFCSTNAMHFLLGYANALILAAFAEISQVMGRMTRPGPMQLAHGTIRKLHSATFHAGTSVLACHRRGRRREHLERWLKSTSGGALGPTRASLKPFRSNRLHLVKQMHWVAASKANEGPKYATHLANCDNSRNCIQPRVGANPGVAPRRRSGARAGRSTG